MSECILCKIAKKESPAHLVFESDNVIAFLDIHPVTKGHILIIPKNHYQDVFDIPESALEEIIVITKKLAKQCKEKLLCDGVNLFNANGKVAQQDVFHFHLIPRYANEKLNLWFPENSYESSGQELEKTRELLS